MHIPSFRLPTFLIILMLAIPAAAREAIQLPDMGESASTILSGRQEKELGQAFMRQLQQQVDVLQDLEVNDYLQSLGNRLAIHADRLPYNYHFFIVNDPVINAFAAPGGYIGIHTGLFLAAESESELAAVLAHEIAHLTQHHLARALEAANKMNLPLAAAMLAAVLVSTQSSEAGQAALMTLQAGSIQQQINFTRGNEKEADNIGMQILHRAGFDPAGMPAFFERLLLSTRYAGDKPPEFLSTHPVTTNRIAESRFRAQEFSATEPVAALSFDLAKAKLRVLTDKDPRKAQQFFSDALSVKNEDDTELRYGLALAQIRQGGLQQAGELLQKLQRDDPDQIAYYFARGHLEFQAGRFAQAGQIYRDALRVYPGNISLTLLHSEALLQSGKAEEAQQEIEALIRRRSDLPAETYRLLGQAQEQSGRRIESLTAMAEYHYRSGRVHKAIEILERVLKFKDLNFYQSARVEARLKQFKTEISPKS